MRYVLLGAFSCPAPGYNSRLTEPREDAVNSTRNTKATLNTQEQPVMNIFRKFASLFAGGLSAPQDVGLYYYVKCDRCGEVIRVRINPMNDLSQTDEGQGYFVRKVIVGTRCYNRIEAEFSYGLNRKLANTTISGGKLVDTEAYNTYQRNTAH